MKKDLYNRFLELKKRYGSHFGFPVTKIQLSKKDKLNSRQKIKQKLKKGEYND
jgi:2-oxo-4-hydroxy-4-carboxy--5-ureidoimidazoline (OHCU) decarboxylase